MVRVLDCADVGRLVGMAEAIAAVREATAAAGVVAADLLARPAALAARLAAKHGAGRDVPLGDW